MKTLKNILSVACCATVLLIVLSFDLSIPEDIIVTDPCSCDNGGVSMMLTQEDIDITNGIIDGCQAPYNCVKTFVLKGNFSEIAFQNLSGLEGCGVLITNNGIVEIGSIYNSSHTFKLTDSRNVEISGVGFNGEETEAIGGGLRVVNGKAGSFGLIVSGVSENINIHHLDVANPNGFAGIAVKNSPGNENVEDACTTLHISGISIHHNYVHDISTESVEKAGEGLYIGDTAFLGREKTKKGSSCTYVYPPGISNISIHSNEISNTSWDGIQLGGAIEGAEIYDNRVYNYGLEGKGGQSNGIQIGEGSRKVNCFNNLITNDEYHGNGNGIVALGAGESCIFNNIIVKPSESGVFVNESVDYKVPAAAATSTSFVTIQGCQRAISNKNCIFWGDFIRS